MLLHGVGCDAGRSFGGNSGEGSLERVVVGEGGVLRPGSRLEVSSGQARSALAEGKAAEVGAPLAEHGQQVCGASLIRRRISLGRAHKCSFSFNKNTDEELPGHQPLGRGVSI